MVYLPDDVRVVLFLPESEVSGAGEKVVVVSSSVLLYLSLLREMADFERGK